MIKACIFDLDGTLLYTIDTIAYYVNETFQKYGFPEIPTAEVQKNVGGGARDLIKKCMRYVGAFGDDGLFERVYLDYKRAYDSDPFYLTRPYDSVPELIARLRADGISLGVFSNKPHAATVAVTRHFFGDAFSEVWGATPDFPLKPDPTRLFDMAARLGVEPCEIAYFGDMSGDILTGKNAGAGVVGAVGWGYESPDSLRTAGGRLFYSPTDILEVIK